MTSTTLPRFSRYYSGPWPYSLTDGVGLVLSGMPTDVHAFIDTLQGEGCSPVATRRILTELEAGRPKYTTVRSHLDFNFIGDALAEVGVTLTIVPPAPPQNPEYDHAALMLLVGMDADLERFTTEERELIQERHLHTRASLARIPHDFGAFA